MTKLLKKIKTFVNILFCRLIFLFSFLVPKKNNLWIFIGWHKNKEREVFADNSKYFFLHVSKNLPNIKAVWIGKDKKIVAILEKNGLEAHSINSLMGIYYSLRANYTIIDALFDIKNWRYSGGSKIIQLWHGKSTKKTGFDSPYSLKRYNPILFPNLFIKPIFMIAASPLTQKLHASSFRMDENKIWVTGLPKHVAINHEISGMEIDINQDLKNQLLVLQSKGLNKKILFAPTFRPDGSSPLDSLNLNKIEENLEKENFLLVIALHPKFATKDWSPKNTYKNIIFAQSGFDMYPLFSMFDAMISDYSSMVLEFLLLNKPVILHAPDIEKYREEMGIYDEIWNLKPGPITKTSDELIEEIKNIGTNKINFETNRLNALDELFTYKDSEASNRVAQIILEKKWKNK